MSAGLQQTTNVYRTSTDNKCLQDFNRQEMSSGLQLTTNVCRTSTDNKCLQDFSFSFRSRWLGKAHTRSAPSLSSLPKVALETVPIYRTSTDNKCLQDFNRQQMSTGLQLTTNVYRTSTDNKCLQDFNRQQMSAGLQQTTNVCRTSQPLPHVITSTNDAPDTTLSSASRSRYI